MFNEISNLNFRLITLERSNLLTFMALRMTNPKPISKGHSIIMINN